MSYEAPGKTELTLVRIFSDWEPVKLTVHNVLDDREDELAICVDWIGGESDSEDSSFLVRLCIRDYGGSSIEFVTGTETAALISRALSRAASECDYAQIMDYDQMLYKEWHAQDERNRAPLWLRLARCFKKAA
jgi:hypothetical protein